MISQKVMLSCFLVNLLMLSPPIFSSDFPNEITSPENVRSYDYRKISKAIGYEFKNKELLLQALTRRSALNEGLQEPNIGDFQRLEFIGDRVLNLVISDILFDNHPDWKEGQLTSELNKFTHNKGPLASIAKKLKLGKFLIMGLGEEKLNLRKDTKVLSDAYEALIGAIWCDTKNNYTLIKGLIREHFKSLGLIDFKDEYQKQTVILDFMEAYNDTMEMAMPEIYEAEGGLGISLLDLLGPARLKQRTTKPLSGLASAFEKSLVRHSDDNLDSDDSDGNSQFTSTPTS